MTSGFVASCQHLSLTSVACASSIPTSTPRSTLASSRWTETETTLFFLAAFSSKKDARQSALKFFQNSRRECALRAPFLQSLSLAHLLTSAELTASFTSPSFLGTTLTTQAKLFLLVMNSRLLFSMWILSAREFPLA